MKRIGYYLSDKKSRRFNFEELTGYCRRTDLELIKIDLDLALEDQGPFDVIFHKLTDVISSAKRGDAKSQQWILSVENYIQNHPEVRILDPVDNVRQLLDRHTQYQAIRKCSIVADETHVFMPTFVEFTTGDVEKNKQLLKSHGVRYPFLCKPAVANGSLSHQMSIIFNERGLQDVKPPCVAHTFINHNAALYKVFVIGDQHFLVKRPSVKNLQAGDQTTIFFDSHDVSKPDSACFLNELDDIDRMSPFIQPRQEELFQLAHSIQADLGLSLFGVDVIVENNTGRYALIDINAFPRSQDASYLDNRNPIATMSCLPLNSTGYEGVTAFYKALADLLSQAAWSDVWPVSRHGNMICSFTSNQRTLTAAGIWMASPEQNNFQISNANSIGITAKMADRYMQNCGKKRTENSDGANRKDVYGTSNGLISHKDVDTQRLFSNGLNLPR